MNKTIEQLQKKAASRYGSGVKMPSIKKIKQLLDSLSIDCFLDESYNTVEYSSRGRRYVNSRHRGKEGYKLTIPLAKIEMDTSDSYYNIYSRGYAEDILKFIEGK